MPSGQMAELPADPVADYRGANLAPHHEADPGRLSYGAYQQVTGDQGLTGAAAVLNRSLELLRAPQPGGRGKHRQSPLTPGSDQTLTRARPFRRLADSTARPARVRMRSRKPCVLARRRLFG
jgi:hypothetical protein